MKDAATYCRWKFILEAVLRIPIGAILLIVAFVVVPAMTHDEVAKGHGSWSMLVCGVIPLVIGWLIFSSGARRLHAVCLTGCRLQAGPEGIFFRLPWRARPQTLFLTYKIAELKLSWSDVLKAYPVRYKLNGIPFGEALIIETRRGRFNFGGYFKEPAAAILAVFHDQRPPG